MKTSFISTFVLSLFLILFSSTVIAQIPRVLSYQGAINDNNGRPVQDGSHNITFKLYTFPLAGEPIYTETQAVTIKGGIFSATIGIRTAIPASVKFDSAYFLSIAVDGGTEMSPRTLLTAAPYSLNSLAAVNSINAVRAGSADSLSPNAAGVVRSINGQSGAITVLGVGATKVTTVGSTISINVPPGTGDGIQGVTAADTSIIVANSSGPIASVRVAPLGINNSKMAVNAISNGNIQDLAVTVSKMSSLGATRNNVATADNNGNVIWQQPILQLPYVGVGTNPSGSVFTIANSGSVGTTIRALSGAGAGLGIVTTATIWADGGTGYNGVVGYSDGGSSSFAGVQGRGNNSSAGVAGIALSGDGVTGTSNTGRAGFFTITNTSSSANGIEASNAGSGDAIKGLALKDGATAIHGVGSGQGTSTGVFGETLSADAGSGATAGPTGVLGKASSTSPNSYSAGVRGINGSTDGNGIGVVGYQAGSGWGVYGETPSGNSVYGKATNATVANNGVLGETVSPNGAGVKASYTGTGAGNALIINNGAIKVSGTNKAAFVHTVTNANKVTPTNTQIDNPLCNGDPNAIILVMNQQTSGGINNKNPTAVVYNTTSNKWEIANINGTAITTGVLFNVLIIKQ